MNPAETDWLAVLERVREGDGRAFLEMSRLITYILSGMRAYDFRSEWDDVIQDVIVATDKAVAAGRVRDSAKLLAYIRVSTRNRFIDSFRRGKRQSEREDPIEDAQIEAPASEASIETRLSVQDAVERLAERERAAVLAVYVDGQTYDEAAETLAIPLGSLKRFLRQGLANLKQQIQPVEPS